MSPTPELSAYAGRADEALRDLFADPLLAAVEPRLRAAMHYSLLAGGKRLRPMLFYAALDAFADGKTDSADANRAACAIECIHTYSLIHDDLPAMDNDDLRRGQPTCHRAFDEATAILAGDALHTLAFELLGAMHSTTAEVRLALIGELSSASGCRGMVGGQAIDLAHVGRRIDRSGLENMHSLKTGALILAALRMGAILARAAPPIRAALDSYARALGLAFQVRDDVLDCSGDAAELGKNPGSDAAQAKPTFATLLGQQAASEYADSLAVLAIEALDALGGEAEPLREIARFVSSRRR